ncbi:uncharacterized protein HMPREF1541_10889 [Cyphellophora europaea CBS 101466]|uniref:Uncharacterized protein n=1 Tax=Cyphellophora europaea (strain CBS 101466) TaxID=1220924 RepID=W2S7X8_CYPE1|nr:uncharacterized protein HMPREF1541_10889 [Cyphellophora europaea CBS 101466]ETN44024.1 hypothetical protein HMPREF1541_10889 [Cyphellophora europaea CBS 101466]
MADNVSAFRDRSQHPSIGGDFLIPEGWGYLATPRTNDLRTRLGSQPSSNIEQETQRVNSYQLIQPSPRLHQELRTSAGFAQDPYVLMPSQMSNRLGDFGGGSGNTLLCGSLGQQHQQQCQQLVMVPVYIPIYGSPDQRWPGTSMTGHQQGTSQGAPPGHQGMHMPISGCGLVQYPLAPTLIGPVEKQKKRRAPPSPQYLHMTVQEMIEELAYRNVDTAQLQAKRAKKADYIGQLQWADREGIRGRGAWKSCHGNAPPLSEIIRNK